jgi:transcriptional regulator with XRE-family HTH domain
MLLIDEPSNFIQMDSKEEILHKFGKHLTFLRQQKNLSIRELAEASGLEYGQVQQIEEGRINLLFTTIVSLADALELPPEELLQTL